MEKPDRETLKKLEPVYKYTGRGFFKVFSHWKFSYETPERKKLIKELIARGYVFNYIIQYDTDDK